jgi:hypothetical protein
MTGRGRGWRGAEPTPQAWRCLNALRDGGEHPSSAVATSAGLGQANAINTLKNLRRDGYVESRLESVSEHRARDKDPGKAFKGPRRELWKLTRAGRDAVNG